MKHSFRVLQKNLSGGVMLVSILVLAAMLLIFAILGLHTTLERGRSGMSLEQKAMAKSSANSCLEVALQNLGNDHAYQGNVSLEFGDVPCSIRPIYQVNGQYVVEVSAQSGMQYYRSKTILLSVEPIAIKSSLEVENF